MIYKLDNIEITDTQLDELLVQRKANKLKYPLFKRWKKSGEIVKFSSLKEGTIVVKGKDSGCEVEYISDTFTFHVDDRWEDILYNKERDLFHTQAVECWDENDTHSRLARFYNAVDDCVFSCNGDLHGWHFHNCKAIPLDEVSDWMNEARGSLEK